MKQSNKIFFIPLRYLIALGLVFTLPIIYQFLTPLTTYYIAFILNFFYNVTVISCERIMVNFSAIEIIPACVAGSAYILLLTLNLTTPMKLKKRLLSILFSIAILFLINTLRLVFLTFLIVQNSEYFDIVHKLFWYVLSTIFVIAIWFLTVKLFDIKEIPVYSDVKLLVKNIKQK